MAAVLTLDRTLSEAESCSFSWSGETLEVPPDEEDTAGRSGLVSSGMKGESGIGAPAARTSAHALPPIGYHALSSRPNDDCGSLNTLDRIAPTEHVGLQELRTDV